MSFSLISSLVAQVMQQCNLKQKDLAVVLDVSLDRVKSLTSGKVKKLTPDETRRLVQTLNLSAHWLATGEGPMFNPQGGEALGELLTQLRLCSVAVASMGFSGDDSAAVRDIAYGVATSNAEAVKGGIDVLRPAMTEDERGLLADYREASGPVRRAARAALQSGAAVSPAASRVTQNIRAPVRGDVAGGNITKGK